MKSRGQHRFLFDSPHRYRELIYNLIKEFRELFSSPRSLVRYAGMGCILSNTGARERTVAMPDDLFEPQVNHKQIQLEYRESLFQHVDRDASGSYKKIFKLCYQCKRTFESPAITTLLEARFGEEAEFHDWHTSTSSFKQSITEKCHSCTLVHTLIETRDPPITLDRLDPGAAIEFSIKRWLGERGLRQDGFRPSGILRITIKLGGDVEIEIDVKNTMSSYDHWASVHGALDQARTDSVEHVALARLFVNHCMTRHGPFLSSCNWRDGTFVPKRLLELTADSTGEISEVKLRIMSDEENEIEYCCLSHCWGEEQPLMLTDANIERLTNGIPVADIPPTYLDAIKITLSLGIRYLWVDSLCIIQGNEQDWTTEAAAMSDVYTNAYVTIAAATASTAQDGCYTTRDPLTFAPCRIRGSTKEDVLFAAPRFIKGCEIEDLERTTTLFTRAWVFQERLLSPRILYYGPLGLAFNCCCARTGSRVLGERGQWRGRWGRGVGGCGRGRGFRCWCRHCCSCLLRLFTRSGLWGRKM